MTVTRGWLKKHLAPTRVALVAEVRTEMAEQDLRWGQQDHPLIGGHPAFLDAIRARYRDREELLKQCNDHRAGRGRIGWDTILLEEVCEALASDTPQQQVDELVQVAAVALQAAAAVLRADR